MDIRDQKEPLRKLAESVAGVLGYQEPAAGMLHVDLSRILQREEKAAEERARSPVADGALPARARVALARFGLACAIDAISDSPETLSKEVEAAIKRGVANVELAPFAPGFWREYRETLAAAQPLLIALGNLRPRLVNVTFEAKAIADQLRSDTAIALRFEDIQWFLGLLENASKAALPMAETARTLGLYSARLRRELGVPLLSGLNGKERGVPVMRELHQLEKMEVPLSVVADLWYAGVEGRPTNVTEAYRSARRRLIDC